MGILKYLPTFNQIEPDNLLGLTMGYVLAQIPAKYTGSSFDVPTVKDGAFIENGILCAIGAEGKVVKATTADAQVFIHFTEELLTTVQERKYFAVETNGDETFLRLVALVPGSEWTVTSTGADNSRKAACDTETYDAFISAGRIKKTAETTLPNGDKAVSYLFIK